MFRKSLHPFNVKKFYPAAASKKLPHKPTPNQSQNPNPNNKKPTFNTADKSKQAVKTPAQAKTTTSILLQAFLDRLKENRSTWAHILIPDLNKPKFNQDYQFKSQKKNSFLVPGQKEHRGKREESIFRFPVEFRFVIVVCVLIYYMGRIVIAMLEDTSHGKLLQEIFKRLVRSRILIEQKERLQMLDEDGEENDLIPQGFALLSREEMIQLFQAMNWYAISHRTYTGFVEVGDTNPMVTTVLLNSKLYVWMLNLLAKPDTFSDKGLMDFEFVTECSNALLRFAHDETVSKKLVDIKALPILRLVRRELQRMRDHEDYRKLYTSVTSENEGEKRIYTVNDAILSVEDLICEMVGFKWTHGCIQEGDMHALIEDMCSSRRSAEKLTKSLNGSWWTQFSSTPQDSRSNEHIFQQFPQLQCLLVQQLKQHGYSDLAESVNKHTLPTGSLHELWKYAVMHRDNLSYTVTAACGFTATVALTWFTNSFLLKRRMAHKNYFDGYLRRHIGAYSTFVSCVVAAHYVVLYPWMLSTIRDRVEVFKQDTQLIFAGSFLPLCVHNYKIFASYVGMLLILTATALQASVTLSIITGASLSMWMGLIGQHRAIPDVDASEFNRGVMEELNRQLVAVRQSPKRLLRGLFLVDEDERHHMPRKYANVLVEGARLLLKNVRVTEVNSVLQKSKE